MKYYCKKCNKEIDSQGQILFCPYCGASLQDTNSIEHSLGRIANIMDNNWGEVAHNKQHYVRLMQRIISQICCLARQYENIAPNSQMEKLEPFVKRVLSCENRKSVLNAIDILLQKIQSSIDVMPTEGKTTMIVSSKNKQQLGKITSDFLGEFGISVEDNIIDGINTITHNYSRPLLQQLFNEVELSYGKYERCVNENGMYAAFPSTSRYGNCRFLVAWEDNSDFKLPSIENPQEELSLLHKSNQSKYLGLLDEDFVPHVDAFWRGVLALVYCLDNNACKKTTYPHSILENGYSEKLLNIVKRYDFEVTEEKVGALEDIVTKLDSIATV